MSLKKIRNGKRVLIRPQSIAKVECLERKLKERDKEWEMMRQVVLDLLHVHSISEDPEHIELLTLLDKIRDCVETNTKYESEFLDSA